METITINNQDYEIDLYEIGERWGPGSLRAQIDFDIVQFTEGRRYSMEEKMVVFSLFFEDVEIHHPRGGQPSVVWPKVRRNDSLGSVKLEIVRTLGEQLEKYLLDLYDYYLVRNKCG